MSRKQLLGIAGWLLGAALSAGSWVVSGQHAGPAETKGVLPKQIAAVDLGPEIEGLTGRLLRARVVTVVPGGILGVHNHRDRPGTVYVVQGRITEHRSNVTNEYGPGDSWSEDKETTHWLENRGTAPVVLVAVDIFKQQ